MKVNIGSGGTKIDGFTSLDWRPEVNPDILADIIKYQFEENSLDEIYFSHGLEHFTYIQVDFLLGKMWRWLKKGGVLWVAVPDFGILCRLVCDGYWNEYLQGLLFGNERYYGDVHKSGWTRKLLREKLEQFGFIIQEEFLPFVKNEEGSGCDASGVWWKFNDETTCTLSINYKCLLEK